MTWVELYQVVRIPKFSRIPPACCPYLPACTARGGTWSGLYLPGPRGVLPAWSGVYLVWGVYLAGPGGCTCLVLGGVPGPGEGVPAWSWRGFTWSWGVYMVWGVYLVPGGYLPGPRGVPAQALPPVNRILDTRF